MLRNRSAKKQQNKQQKLAKFNSAQKKTAKPVIHKRSVRKTHHISSLPEITQESVQYFLPDVPALDLCNNLTPEQTSTLFSSKLPHTTKSLQKMEFFITNLQ